MPKFNEDASMKTLVGERSAIKGSLKTHGYLRFDGDIDGNLSTDGTLFVGEKARIRGDVSANSAVVGGVIIGNLTAPEGIRLLSSSVVIGDVRTKSLQADDNVVIHGKCISIADEEQFNFLAERDSAENSVRQKLQFQNS